MKRSRLVGTVWKITLPGKGFAALPIQLSRLDRIKNLIRRIRDNLKRAVAGSSNFGN